MNYFSHHVPKREEAKALGANLKDLTAIADHFGAAFVLIGVAMSCSGSSLEILQFTYFALGNYQDSGQSYNK